MTSTLEDPAFVSKELLSLEVHCEANPREETLLSEASFFTYQAGGDKVGVGQGISNGLYSLHKSLKMVSHLLLLILSQHVT